MNQRRDVKIQDPVPLVTKHLNAVRQTSDYQRFLAAVVRSCKAKGSRPEENLAKVADAVLRPIARDLSACCPGNKVVIFHMMALNERNA